MTWLFWLFSSNCDVMGKNRSARTGAGSQASLRTDNISQYLKEVQKYLSGGLATEHTYRPALQRFIESSTRGITATNEPKRVKCGAPDFIITRKEIPLGHIEAKDVGKSLDAIEKDARSANPRTSDGEQLKRYREGLNNLILTNYLEFRWYVGGDHRMSVRLARVGAQGKLRKEKDGEKQTLQLISQFLAAKVTTIGTPKELAARMAAMARLIRQIISRALEDEDNGGSLHDQMEGFRQVLLHSLKPDEFADMYAQTICYGLFAARCNHNGGQPFTRQQASYELPRTNPFLRKMFGYMAGPELDHRVTWAVDDLAELLNRADMNAILKDFGKRTRREDPVLHFYETFLAAYDPKMREARGVYYTPEPVVSYIVRSVDQILKKDFGLPDGLAETSKVPVYETVPDKSGKPKRQKTRECHKVLILDPAVGTGTFLHGVIDHIHERIVGRGQAGMWSGYVSEHLLPRLFGFELLMAPYAMAHMKLDLQLKETKYNFKTDERLNIFLTNTLEEGFAVSHVLPFANWLAEEANKAGRVKKDFPVMVVLGNPPYSGHSQTPAERIVEIKPGQTYFVESKGGRTERKATKLIRRKEKTFIGRLIQDYFYVDGEPLKERQVKWLHDDYVKFIRFAQWRIEQTGYGILAFITNHSYLDNPTFRGMRQSLTTTFDDIYILDLHGNTKKKEKCPDGSKDENVFDIQQGVAIGIFVKRSTGVPPVNNHGQVGHATIRHAHLWGLRELREANADGQRQLTGGKYYCLNESSIGTTEWASIHPQKPFYLFVPQDTNLLGEYEAWWRISDAMPENNVGFVTARDRFVIGFDEKVLLQRIKEFRAKDADVSSLELSEKYGLKDTTSWNLETARQRLRADRNWQQHFRSCLYRPFDIRHIYYSLDILERPVYQIQRHMLAGKNIGLIATRQTRDEWHVFSTRHIMGHKSLAAYDINSLFPLYLYPKPEQDNLLDVDEPTNAPGGRRPNLAKEFISELSSKLRMTFIPDGKGDLKKTFGPEDVFNYMYAVFHSPTYRSRYAEFLKIDFPRLPLTSKQPLFRALCGLGEELVGLHLMEKQAPPKTRFDVAGVNHVEKVRYTQPGQTVPTGRVWINKEQYFDNVPKNVWEFHIGGYQVCQKWLKDRKGRKLSYDDLQHYRCIVSSLTETIRLMAEINQTIDKHGGWPIK